MGSTMGEGKGQNSGYHQEEIRRYIYDSHLYTQFSSFILLFICTDDSMDAVEVETRELCMNTVHDLSAGKVSEVGLDAIGQLPTGPGDEKFCRALNKSLLKLEGDPIFSVLELQLNPDESLIDLFKAIVVGETSECQVNLLSVSMVT